MMERQRATILCVFAQSDSAFHRLKSLRIASIQAAIDANPGRMIQVPARDYLIGQPLRIKTAGTGLYGFGRIVQTNAAASIVEIKQATNVLLRDLTLMRPAAQADTTEHAVRASDCDGVELDRLRVIDNRSLGGTLFLERCRNSRVQNCIVKNYKRIGIDDRTGSDLYGYAFHAIDGTGILITESEGIAVHNNHVIEANIYPTRETKERHQLGQLTAGRKPTNKGKLAPRGDYVNNWHQGSAITVTSPEKTRHVQVIGNHIENAAQGIDLHADQVIIQGNVVYDTGKDQVLEEGKPVTVAPRYHYAVFITPQPRPEGLRFSNNIFHPGKSGMCNLEWDGLR